MTIETKFNIDQEVWFIMKNKPQVAKVKAIGYYLENLPSEIKYWIDKNPCGSQYTTCFYESDLFPSKESLLKSL